jgi:hypothetical protein
MKWMIFVSLGNKQRYKAVPQVTVEYYFYNSQQSALEHQNAPSLTIGIQALGERLSMRENCKRTETLNVYMEIPGKRFVKCLNKLLESFLEFWISELVYILTLFTMEIADNVQKYSLLC